MTMFLQPNDGADKVKKPWKTDAMGALARSQLQAYRHDWGSTLGMAEDMFTPGLVQNVSTWWCDYGENAAQLQDVAYQVAPIPAAESACERVFSAVAHIWTDNRNRLLMGRAAMLSFVYFNKRGQDRITAVPTNSDWMEMLEAVGEQQQQVCIDYKCLDSA